MSGEAFAVGTLGAYFHETPFHFVQLKILQEYSTNGGDVQ
jgi:hypothetical protein